ncbi:MAG: hypothetical protein NC403_08380 [Muribaculaceae bacterium]|nr:hypothetical protein [Muribaculaceae bacterium]
MDVNDIKLRPNTDLQFNTLQDDIVYVVLSGSKLAQELQGCIYKTSNPVLTMPPTSEVCYISSLSNEADSAQLGTTNVNIYVPDITDCTKQAGVPAISANTSRLKHLAELAYEALKQHYCENGWCFTCIAQDVLEERQLQCHRLWLKLRFVFHNV